MNTGFQLLGMFNPLVHGFLNCQLFHIPTLPPITEPLRQRFCSWLRLTSVSSSTWMLGSLPLAAPLLMRGTLPKIVLELLMGPFSRFPVFLAWNCATFIVGCRSIHCSFRIFVEGHSIHSVIQMFYLMMLFVHSGWPACGWISLHRYLTIDDDSWQCH